MSGCKDVVMMGVAEVCRVFRIVCRGRPKVGEETGEARAKCSEGGLDEGLSVR